jgi:hypothetical protein
MASSGTRWGRSGGAPQDLGGPPEASFLSLRALHGLGAAAGFRNVKPGWTGSTPGQEVRLRNAGEGGLSLYRWFIPRGGTYFLFGEAEVMGTGQRLKDTTFRFELPTHAQPA